MSQVQWSCECAGSQLAGLSVGVCVPECVYESCLPWIRRLVGHVAYVSLTPWVTEKPPYSTVSCPLHPLFHKHARMQVHKAEEREGWEVAEGGREGGEEGGARR